jgi:phospholipid/cholesterol/gamma-HCH transport system substrate-binding protein
MDFAEPVATNLQTTLGNLNTILAGLARNTSRLDTMFIRLQETPSEINRTVATANREMVELSDTFKGVAGNLNGRLDELQPTLANFKTLSDSLKAMEINGTLKKVQETLANLNKTISLLSNGDNTMSKLMTEDSLYVNLNALLLTLDTLADHFNTNPKHFLSPLGKSRSKIERDLRKQEDD